MEGGNDEVGELALVGIMDDFSEVGEAFVGWIYGGLPIEVSGVQAEAVIVGDLDHVITVREAIHLALFVAGIDECLDRAGGVGFEFVAEAV